MQRTRITMLLGCLPAASETAVRIHLLPPQLGLPRAVDVVISTTSGILTAFPLF